METTINKTIRAAIYLRVSTDEQLKGYGLAVQEEKLRAFVKLNDYTLDENRIYKDEGFSGSLPASDRPGIKKLLEDATKKEFDIVIVYRLDRLFRKVKLLLQALEDLDKNKIGFKSVTESIDTTSSTGRFVLVCLAAIAEMEKDTIRERTMGGRISAAKDGKWVTGIPPYGYSVNKKTKKLKIVPEEAKWVRLFFKWVVENHLSLREIQQRANNMKIPLPRRKVSNKKTLNFWHKRTIGRMLTNENYTGTVYFRKYKRPFNNLTSLIDESLLREKSDWISIDAPAIVSRETFEACKRQLLKNREFSKRNQKRDYLFSKIIYCGNCGFKLFGGYQPPKRDGNSGSKYYHGVCSKDPVGTTQRCKTCEQIGETRLYPIWDYIKDILKQPAVTLEKLRKYNEEKVSKDDTEVQIAQIDKAIASLATKRSRLGHRYALDETYDYEIYKKDLQECEAQENQLRQDRMRLERQLLDKKGIKKIAELIETQYQRLTERVDSLTYADQREAIRLMVKKVIVYPKRAEAEVELNFNMQNQATSPLLAAFTSPGRALLRDNNAGRISRVPSRCS